MKKKSLDCPLCEEHLKLHKEASLSNGEEVVPIYVCEECDQAFAIIDGLPHIAPYDAKMKPILEVCKECGHEECFRQKMVYLCNDLLIYDSFCEDCAVGRIRQWKNYADKKGIKEITVENVQEVADIYNMVMENEVMADPVKYRKAMETPQMRERK